MLERIQKIISAAGITSRRAAEQLIIEGRVRVNGKVVTELGTKADASKDHIKVDGKLINPKQPPLYLMLNKPAGYVTTMADPEGRPTVQHLLKGVKARVYPVGRLDYNTEGLLLLTNDGDFAHLITHPKHEFPKTYLAKVKGVLEDSQIAELEKGIYLDDGKTAPAKIKKVSKEEANSWLEITIHEGRKRQVRRMFDRVGHSVIRLKRIRTGNLTLGDLPEGAFRYLTGAEVKALNEEALKPEVRTSKPEIRRQRTDDRSRTKVARVTSGVDPREYGTQQTGKRRPRPEEGRSAGPGRMMREEGRGSGRGSGVTAQRFKDKGQRRGTKGEGPKQSQGVRVPGKGASGRGPRRAPRDGGQRTWKAGPEKTGGRGDEGRERAVKRKAEGQTWRKPGSGRRQSEERGKPFDGKSPRPRSPLR